MSGPYAKQVQAVSPGLNSTAAGSAGFYRSSSAAPAFSRRAQTADKGYRDMNPKEQSFFYDRAIKEDSVREALQSPYVNGRKNNSYINPTFQSTSFLNHNFESQRHEALARGSMQRAASQSALRNSTVFNTQPSEPVAKPVVEVASARVAFVEAPVENKKLEIQKPVAEPVEVKTSQSVKYSSLTSPQRGLPRRAGEFNPINMRSRDTSRAESHVPTATVTATATATATAAVTTREGADELDVCDGCLNWQLAEETHDRKLRKKRASVDIECEILERNAQACRVEREINQIKRDIRVEASQANLETFKEKAQRKASAPRDREDDVELKVNTNKGIAAESLRTLQRYQSMLDKMYESSVKKIGERKAELKERQQHNREAIAKHEYEAPHKGAIRESDFHHGGDKSMLETMYDSCNRYMNTQANERRRASEYNYHNTEVREYVRMASPVNAKPFNDPFKANTEQLEEVNVGKGVLDKMFNKSMERWKRVKEGIYESSQNNKDTIEYKRSRTRENNRDQGNVHENWAGYRKGWNEDGTSVLDSVYQSDQHGLAYRRFGNTDCSSFNKDTAFSPERMNHIKNLEDYYKSPTKKVNERNAVDYDHWSRKGAGVFGKIEAATDRLEQERREQYQNLGSGIKKQMVEGAAKKSNEHQQNKAFKETPLLVCAHNSNVMYCNVCNRKVPMNKISKIVGEYKKLLKCRGRK